MVGLSLRQTMPGAESSHDRKAGRICGTDRGNVRRKVPVWDACRSVRLITKNEPVAGRNIFHRAGPWLGAKLAPWLWTGGTKEVRTRKTVILVDTGGALP